MKRNIIYIAVALMIGFLLGYFIFHQSADYNLEENQEHQHSEDDEQMWTCSMHPQIMQPNPGTCPICGMDLIPAEKGAESLSPNEIKMTENAMALANIQTTKVGVSTIKNKNHLLTLSGKIMQNEEANAVQASYFEGRIEKLHINYTGEPVRKGQLLATIYAPSLVNTQQELITTASMKESQPDLYLAVRNKLKLWKLSDKQINQIEASGKVQEVFPIYATVSGTVSEKLADEGDYVSQGQPIFRVNNLNSVWAMFDAYENQIAQIKVGQHIEVTTNAYPNYTYNATINFIDPVLNTASRTVAVRATLNNSGGRLKPGMFATGKIENNHTTANTASIQVPATAVLWTGKRSLVYVKTNPNEPIFEMREITIGDRVGEFYTIIDGLNQGEEIVTNGTFTVDAAAQLQGKKSMMMQQSTHEPQNQSYKAQKMSRIEVPDKFKKQLKAILIDYIAIKDALAGDDAGKAQAKAKELNTDLKQVEGIVLDNQEAINQWEQIKKNLGDAASEIGATSDIIKQRKDFIALTKAMSHGIQMFGIDTKVYSAFCPMANDDKGASWLSLEKEIKNPYFGKSMLNCGEIQKTIQ